MSLMSSHPNRPAFPPHHGSSLQSSAQGAFQEILTDAFAEVSRRKPASEPLCLASQATSGETAPGEQGKPLFMLIEQGPAAGQAFQIVQGNCLIGRASVVDLLLKHPSVSRRHAQLKRLGNHLYIRDLGSHNGTYVNQQRIAAETEVFVGDAIAIGTSLLTLKDTLPFEDIAPHNKPAHKRKAPYTLLVASLTASFSTLVAMVLLKLIFQPPAPSSEVDTSPPPSEVVVLPPSAPLPDTDNVVLSSSSSFSLSSSSPFSEASVLEAFNQGRAEEALRQTREANHLLLSGQLAAFLSQWEKAENLWREASTTKSPSRQALAAHEAALLTATRISADSSYVRELQTRIGALSRMAAERSASAKTPPSKAAALGRTPPPKAAALRPPPPPPPVKPAIPKQAPASKTPPSAPSRELQEKRRTIDEAFGGF